MAIMEISIVPLGTGTTSVSQFVANALKVLKERGVKYQLTPMGTVIEADIDQLFNLARLMHETPFTAGAKRVVTTIKIDDRRDRQSTLESKIESVKQKLDESL